MAGDTFADDVIEELLKRTESGEPLTRICTDPRMPGRTTVYDWLDGDEAFAERFRVARARGVHALAEECLDIADDSAADFVATEDSSEEQAHGGALKRSRRENPESVQRARLRIDTRLRLAGKWLPSIYGDKVQTEVTGKDGGPLQVDETHAAARIAALMALASARRRADESE